MKIKEATQILKLYNQYRRDNNVPSKIDMPNPTQLGIAIDVITDFIDCVYNALEPKSKNVHIKKG